MVRKEVNRVIAVFILQEIRKRHGSLKNIGS